MSASAGGLDRLWFFEVAMGDLSPILARCSLPARARAKETSHGHPVLSEKSPDLEAEESGCADHEDHSESSMD